MKKFLAFLFVCAGLTAMAAPQVNKVDMPTAAKGQMVMKANTLTNNLTSGMVSKNFMEAAKKNVQMNHATNLVNKRAPRHLSNEEIIANPYVCFLYAYDLTSGEDNVAADPFYAGSGAFWYPDASDGLYFAGFYWDEDGSTYYLPLDIDYATGEVALSWGILLRNDSVIGSARNRQDTVTYSMLVSEAYWNDGSQTDCKGTLYEDGSIIFDDNYVYYYEQELRNYVNGRLKSCDTTIVAKMFVGTEILAANGVLEYTRERDNVADSSNVYMFQSNDTLYVGNLWDYGMPSAAMTLTEDGKAHYECSTFDPTDSMTYLSNPIWDINDTWIEGGLGMCYGIGGYTTTEDGYIDELLWGFTGDATPTQITWDYTAPSNGYHLFYGYNNNKLSWINGGQFVIPGPAYVRGDVDNDGEVTIGDVTTLIDHLLTGNFDDADGFSSDNSDADADGEITIGDVTTLIDFLLTGVWPAE